MKDESNFIINVKDLGILSECISNELSFQHFQQVILAQYNLVERFLYPYLPGCLLNQTKKFWFM